MRSTKKAFTLIELITVTAISSILLTLITIPVVQSFNLTRAAQSFANLQDRSRQLIDTIVRDVTNGSGVRDNSGLKGSLAIVVPGRNGNPETILMPNLKLDIFQPAAAPVVSAGGLRNPNSLIDPTGDPTDPTNWRVDPTLRAPVGQPVLPVSQGFRLVRYFVSLRDPLTVYRNPYDGLLNTRSGLQDNLYVLRKAEVAYRVYNGTDWVFNDDLFIDADNNGEPDNIDGPYFMVPNVDDVSGVALAGPAVAAKNLRIQSWLRASRVVTELSRYDMVQPIYDKRTRAITYDGNVPRMTPLISFAPTRVSNETPDGMLAVRLGEETSNAIKIGPDVYRTQNGNWSQAKVTVWPSDFNQWNPNPVSTSSNRVISNELVPDVNGNLVPRLFYRDTGFGPTEVFDLDAYFYNKSRKVDNLSRTQDWFYSFTYAVDQADGRSGFLSNNTVAPNFIPFAYDRRKGEVVTSFPIQEVGRTGANTFPGSGFSSSPQDNRPEAFVGTAVSPLSDPATPLPANAARWQGAQFSPSVPGSSINQRFNALWQDWDLIFPGLGNKQVLAKRFVDLRWMPTKDGVNSPLRDFVRARLVPGSEIVIGPDQTAGGTGTLVRYSRTTGDYVGPNQYKINYTDQPEPDWTDAIYAGITPPAATYNPTNPTNAILQARYKAGYVEFNSDSSLPIPTGNISISYRFQFNESSDVFAVDYDTQELIDINMTLLTYPGGTTSPEPQRLTLSGSGKVRNFIR